MLRPASRPTGCRLPDQRRGSRLGGIVVEACSAPVVCLCWQTVAHWPPLPRLLLHGQWIWQDLVRRILAYSNHSAKNHTLNNYFTSNEFAKKRCGMDDDKQI